MADIQEANNDSRRNLDPEVVFGSYNESVEDELSAGVRKGEESLGREDHEVAAGPRQDEGGTCELPEEELRGA
jgi:hypothetical protein